MHNSSQNIILQSRKPIKKFPITKHPLSTLIHLLPRKQYIILPLPRIFILIIIIDIVDIDIVLVSLDELVVDLDIFLEFWFLNSVFHLFFYVFS